MPFLTLKADLGQSFRLDDKERYRDHDQTHGGPQCQIKIKIDAISPALEKFSQAAFRWSAIIIAWAKFEKHGNYPRLLGRRASP